MKRITITMSVLGIIVLFLIYTGNKHTVAKGENDLVTLAQVVKSENIDIQGWSLQAREKRNDFESIEEVHAHVKHLKAQFPDWEWTFVSNSEKWEAAATKATSFGTKESIQVISTLTKHKPQTYIIYEAQGKNFNQKIEQFMNEELAGTIYDIFRGDATIFSCILGEVSDKMNKTLPNRVQDLLDSFQAIELESLSENDFISTSAHSPLFSEEIKNNGDVMNLQVGIRTQGLGAKTTIVVGTPIITIEY